MAENESTTRKPITVRLDHYGHQALLKLAEEEHRSTSQMAAVLIYEALQCRRDDPDGDLHHR